MIFIGIPLQTAFNWAAIVCLHTKNTKGAQLFWVPNDQRAKKFNEPPPTTTTIPEHAPKIHHLENYTGWFGLNGAGVYMEGTANTREQMGLCTICTVVMQSSVQ